MSRTFHFSRDGQRVIVLAEDQLDVLHIGTSDPPRHIAVARPRDFLAFDDDVWVVAGDPPQLTRYTFAGRPIGDPVDLPHGEGRLVGCAFGSPTALWIGQQKTVELHDDLGKLVKTDVGEDFDFVVPLGVRRWLTARGNDLRLRNPDGDEQLAAVSVGDDSRVIDGAAIFESRSVVLVLEHKNGGDQHLIVVNPNGGLLQHRLRLEGVNAARFAPRRGYVLLRRGEHDLVLVDLRFGKVLKHLSEPREIMDLELDGAAQHVALRLRNEDGSIATVYTTYRELLAAQALGPAREGEGNGKAAHADDGTDGAAAVARAAHPSGDSNREARVREALAAAAARAATEYEGDDVVPPPVPFPAAAVSPTPQPPSAPEVELPAEIPQLGALLPRPSRPLCPREVSLQLLDRHLELVGAWCERAISLGWDTGQIVFPAESGHPFEKEVAGILGRNSGNAKSQLAASDMRVQQLEASLRYAYRFPEGYVTPLQSLVEEFSLSHLATDILLVAAAPTIWGELARLYGILTNDPDRPLCDELLIHQVIGPGRASRHDVARELDRDSPLIRWGLLRPGEGKTRPFIALTVDPIVVRRLRGDKFDEAEPEEPCSIRRADRTLDEIVAPRRLLVDMLDKLARAPREGFARIVMRGRLGSGRRTILAAFAELANRRLGVIDTSLLPREPRYMVEGLRTELQRAVLRGWLPCIQGLDEITFEDPNFRDRVRELFRSHPGPVAFRVSGEATPPIDPGYTQFDLPALNEVDRLDCWRLALETRELRVRDIEGLASRFRIGPGVVERVSQRVSQNPAVAAVVAHAGANGGNGAASVDSLIREVSDEIEQGVRQFLEVRLGSVANRVTRLASWSNVVLPPDVIDTVREFIGRIKHRKVVYERWGFDRTMSTSRGLTALFQGGPGTGKTMVAGIIARELQLDLYRIDLSRIMSKWIGETERNLANVFDAAEDGQAIILFDEADSLFSKRTEVKSSVDRYANLEVNYLLQRLDSFDGIAILTTNFGGAIDSAFKRRLSLRLTFPFPDEEMREELWRVHIPPEIPTLGEFKLGDLARKYQLSGGYIRNATLRAAFLAAQEESALTQEHLERAVKLEFKELGKLAETGVLE